MTTIDPAAAVAAEPCQSKIQKHAANVIPKLQQSGTTTSHSCSRRLDMALMVNNDNNPSVSN